MCSSCRNRPDCCVLWMPVCRLCANHSSTSTPPEHSYHITYSEDDCGGEQTPEGAQADILGNRFTASLGVELKRKVECVEELCSFQRPSVCSLSVFPQCVPASILPDCSSSQPSDFRCLILLPLCCSFQKIYFRCFFVFSYMPGILPWQQYTAC